MTARRRAKGTRRRASDDRIVYAKKSRAERVGLAVCNFGLSPAAVGEALDRMDLRLEIHRPRIQAEMMGTKESRSHAKKFIRAARLTLGLADRRLPGAIDLMVAYAGLVDRLKAVVAESEAVVESKLTPTRDDGFERCVAVEEAVRLLVGRSPSRKACQDLAAILYGTNDVADVTRAFRSVWERAEFKTAQGAKPDKK